MCTSSAMSAYDAPAADALAWKTSVNPAGFLAPRLGNAKAELLHFARPTSSVSDFLIFEHCLRRTSRQRRLIELRTTACADAFFETTHAHRACPEGSSPTSKEKSRPWTLRIGLSCLNSAPVRPTVLCILCREACAPLSATACKKCAAGART